MWFKFSGTTLLQRHLSGTPQLQSYQRGLRGAALASAQHMHVPRELLTHDMVTEIKPLNKFVTHCDCFSANHLA